MSELFTTTPPTEPGWYWVRKRDCEPLVAELYVYGGVGNWQLDDTVDDHATMIRNGYQFGPRVPSPELCAELNRSPERAQPTSESGEFTGPRSHMIGGSYSVAALNAFLKREYEKLCERVAADRAQKQNKYTLADVHGIYHDGEKCMWADKHGVYREMGELEGGPPFTVTSNHIEIPVDESRVIHFGNVAGKSQCWCTDEVTSKTKLSDLKTPEQVQQAANMIDSMIAERVAEYEAMELKQGEMILLPPGSVVTFGTPNGK